MASDYDLKIRKILTHMKVLKDFTKIKFNSPVLTLGNFDGVHLGHQKILRLVTARATQLGVKSILYTFDPHPMKVVAPQRHTPLILTAPEKIRLVRASGIDYFAIAEFTKKFASKHPRRFVLEVLVDIFNVGEVFVGHDYAFGKGKLGTIVYLEELSKEFGFKLTVVDAYKKDANIVSSSRIRQEVEDGRLGSVARLLGRTFSISGTVVHGSGIGKSLGFATANLSPATELIPKGGVYAVRAVINGTKHIGVANIGFAPTIGVKDKTIEIHLLDFAGDLYGKALTVDFVRRIRGEKKFRTVKALVARIEKDIERARRLL